MRVANMLAGYTLGDAWGYITEFMNTEEIAAQAPIPVPHELTISDDTQMSLYTISAVRSLTEEGTALDGIVPADDSQRAREHAADNARTVRRRFADKYLEFFHDEENWRAPGMTCMSALRNYESARLQAQRLEEEDRLDGTEGVDNYSLGCGTIMRAPWTGILNVERDTLTLLNILHAQTTHGDPRGWVVSAASALMIRDLHNPETASAHNENNADIAADPFRHAVNLVEEIWDIRERHDIQHVADPDMLAQACSTIIDDLHSFIATEKTIDKLLAPTGSFASETDFNDVYGEGWRADESFYNALGILRQHSQHGDNDDITASIERLVHTRGDSDSIAAIGGAFLAMRGNLPHPVINHLEPRYADEIRNALLLLLEHHQGHSRRIPHP